MELAQLPAAQRSELEAAADFSASGDEITCTCGITGSAYTAAWDRSYEAALQLADDAADSTAYLVRSTPHYAWLRSRGRFADRIGESS